MDPQPLNLDKEEILRAIDRELAPRSGTHHRRVTVVGRKLLLGTYNSAEGAGLRRRVVKKFWTGMARTAHRADRVETLTTRTKR